MLMSNFLRNRKSVRDFRRKKLRQESLETIRLLLKSILESDLIEKFEFKLYEDGGKIYQELKNVGGYGGVMIESPHYIGLVYKDDSKEAKIYGAYYMEKLISELNAMALSTCWVGIPAGEQIEKTNALGPEADKIQYLLAFGKEKLRNPFNAEPFSLRIGLEELVFQDQLEEETTIEYLEARGLMDIFYYIRYAPSTKNLQPWRFLLEKDKVKLLLIYDEWEDYLWTDAGIVIYYFEELAKYETMTNKWELFDQEEIQGQEKKYRVIGQYKL